MNLKTTTALIALSLALAGCGNKGSLVRAAPPSVESMPADDAETAAPAETVPVEVVPDETPATDTPPAEALPATEVPATDAQDG